MPSVNINIIAEDVLLATIAKKIALSSFEGKHVTLSSIRVADGKKNIKNKITKYNRAAGNLENPYLILWDLDDLAPPQNASKCPESEIKDFLRGDEKSPHLLARVAVAMAENWLLADIDALCDFLHYTGQRPAQPDSIRTGKQFILNMAKESRKKEIRKDMVSFYKENPRPGKLYNSLMGDFVQNHWRPHIAAKNSKSLRRTLRRLEKYLEEFNQKTRK